MTACHFSGLEVTSWAGTVATPSRRRTPPHVSAPEGKVLWEIRGAGHGERFDKARHHARTYIKAVTYHQLEVEETKGGWQATVFFDV